jgi:hypothetical protein
VYYCLYKIEADLEEHAKRVNNRSRLNHHQDLSNLKLLQFQYLLFQVAFLSEENAFALLKDDSPDDHITYSSFYQALCQVSKQPMLGMQTSYAFVHNARADFTVNAVRNGPS